MPLHTLSGPAPVVGEWEWVREQRGRSVIFAFGVASSSSRSCPLLAPFASRRMQVANDAAQIRSGCMGELGGNVAAAAFEASRGPHRCGLATACNEAMPRLVSRRWWCGEILNMGVTTEGNVASYHVIIANVVRAIAHRPRVGRARERRSRTTILAFGVAPRASRRCPMLAPFLSRHMQVANGAANITSGCMGELGGNVAVAAFEASRCPQRWAMAAAIREEITSLIYYTRWRGEDSRMGATTEGKAVGRPCD